MHITSPLLKRISFLSVVLLLTIPLAALAQRERPSSRQLQQIGAAPNWPSKQKRWAMVIGVDQYADTQITTLGGAANDARVLADALVRYGGFPPDQVFLMSSDQPAERQPTRGNILRRLSNMRSVIPSDGLLLISFAGHGIERGGQAFLLPSDAQVANDVELLEQTAINVTQLKDSIRKTGVGQVVLILDACRNDPVGRGDTDNPLSAAYLRGFNFDVRNREVTAFATLYATAVGHRAYEYKEKHQGYFTWELVEGLKGGAANDKGEVTLEALISYVQERVPKHVLADLGAGKEQKPFAEIGGYKADQLVIAVAATRGSGQTASNTSETTPAVPKVDPAAFELAYWETIKNSSDPEDFKAYLQKYPNGQFADLARRRANPATITSSAPVSGHWIGEWTNTKNASGTSTLNITEDGNGTIRGDEDGWQITNGRRSGDVLTWDYPNVDQCRDYHVTLTILPDRQTANYQYSVVDRCQEPRTFSGTGRYRKQTNSGSVDGNNSQTNPRTATNAASNTGVNPQQTRSVLLADILVLGMNLGMAEVASYQNSPAVPIIQYLTTAQTVAGRSGFSTQAIEYVSRQLQAGAISQSQYQNLVATRQGFEQVLNRNCNCGNVVNLLNTFTLGAQIGFMEVMTYINGDRNYVAKIMTNAIQLAPASGLPTAGLEELLRQLRSGKHTKDVYQPLVSVRDQFIQASMRNCGC